ncbi:Glucose-1-phosphate thymidylyltransferase [Rhodovastum atsumiense]|nr:Glucose-1-phosphate thymidylyltransferase [Rhodovastum atsumiense]
MVVAACCPPGFVPISSHRRPTRCSGRCHRLEESSLQAEKLGRGCAWLDAGTPDSLLQAATFVQTVQSRQGMLVGCPEEVAYRMGWIDADRLRQHARALGKTELGRVLTELADAGLEA